MKIVSQNASTILYEKAKALGRDNLESWRCIYLNMSDRPARYNDGLHRHFIVDALGRLLEDIDGHVYVCEDGDIFILFQWALRPVLRRLGSHFDGITLDALSHQPQDKRFTILDLGRRWPAFFSLCNSKQRIAVPSFAGQFAHFGALPQATRIAQE